MIKVFNLIFLRLISCLIPQPVCCSAYCTTNVIVEIENSKTGYSDKKRAKDSDSEFPGGESALSRYIDSASRYPHSLMSEKLSGVVYVMVLIDERGQITFRHVIDPVHPLFAAEALRVIDGMPAWLPALQKRKPIASLQILPFPFAAPGAIKPEIRKIKLMPKVDEPPQFPGGDQAMFTFLASNVEYLPEALEKKMEGEVTVSFIVNTFGQVEMVQAMTKIGEPCDSEAIRVVGAMPSWKPGRHNQENVNVFVTLPIEFKYQIPKFLPGEEPQRRLKINENGIEIIDPPIPLVKGATVTEKVNDSSDVFQIVEEMPSFPGGDSARFAYLRNNINYPQTAREGRIQGTIYVTFVVERDGSITDIKILRGIGGGCDEEVIRLISMMPRWNPGRQRGKPVRVQFNMPIKYVLGR
ncbi:MAG: energy transducer TonB [Bacteroidales bacterium]|nr:energy transducer TonB [Bacteroidales bacterium]MDD3664511.1 energy transducer TonB [Bacteroidales bacterium]